MKYKWISNKKRRRCNTQIIPTILICLLLLSMISAYNCAPPVYEDVAFERSSGYLIAFEGSIWGVSGSAAHHSGVTISSIDSDGENAVNLTPLTNNDFMPVLSPDGTRIAFVSRRDEEIGTSGIMRYLYIMDVDGSNVHKIPLALQYSPEFLCWSDNGNELIICAKYDGFFSVNINDGTKTSISNYEVAHYTGKLSPDGTKIAYMSGTIIPDYPNYVDGVYRNDCRINVMDIESNEAIIVSQSPEGPYEWDCMSFAWSPDSSKIAFSARYGIGKRLYIDIYTVNVDGTDQTKLVDASKVSSDYVITEVHSWLSQSNKILFTANTDGSVGTGNQDIYTINYDGTDIQRLTNTPAINEEQLVLSPNNEEILCIGQNADGYSANLLVISIEGEDKGRINLTRDLPGSNVNSFSVFQLE